MALQSAAVVPVDPVAPGEVPAVASCPPDDALVEILSRIPVKSLCRFKCVSKAWRDLISGRLRCRRSRPGRTLEGFFYHDHRNYDGVGGHSFPNYYAHLINLSGRPAPLFDRSFSFLKQAGIDMGTLDSSIDIGTLGSFTLHCSCNGLFLFGRWSRRYTSEVGYIVCNPATEQWVAVRRPRFYLPPHFQLVFLWEDINFGTLAGVETYSSKTGVWTDRSSEWRLQGTGDEWEQWPMNKGVKRFSRGTFVNGMLHLIVRRLSNPELDETIVTVDGEGKESRVIRWAKERGSLKFVGESQGDLHCMGEHCNNDGVKWVLTIWVLKDYNTGEWVLKHTTSHWQLFGRVTRPIPSYVTSRSSNYDVLAIHPDYNLFFFVQGWDLNNKLMSYDMNSKDVCTIRTLGYYHWSITPYVPYVTESSVLPNPRNDLYNKKGGYKWLKNGIVEISKVKTAIRNYFTS